MAGPKTSSVQLMGQYCCFQPTSRHETTGSLSEWCGNGFTPMHVRNPGEIREIMLIFSLIIGCAVWNGRLGLFPPNPLSFSLSFCFLCLSDSICSDFSIPALTGQHNESGPLQKGLFHFIKPRSHKLGGHGISNLSTFTAV